MQWQWFSTLECRETFIFNGDEGQSKSCDCVSKQRKHNTLTAKNSMLNCQNVSTFKRMLYCLFLFWLQNIHSSGNASKFFQILDKNLFASLCLCAAIAFFVSQWILQWYAKDSRLNVIPAGSFSLSLPLIFFSFPQFSRRWACSQARLHCRFYFKD